MKAIIKILFSSGFSPVILILSLGGLQTYAQSTVLKLPANNNTSSFDVTKNDNTNIFRIFGDGGFFLGGIHGTGTIPLEGPGPRLMWYPSKSAFRSGNVSGV